LDFPKIDFDEIDQFVDREINKFYSLIEEEIRQLIELGLDLQDLSIIRRDQAIEIWSGGKSIRVFKMSLVDDWK